MAAVNLAAVEQEEGMTEVKFGFGLDTVDCYKGAVAENQDIPEDLLDIVEVLE